MFDAIEFDVIYRNHINPDYVKDYTENLRKAGLK